MRREDPELMMEGLQLSIPHRMMLVRITLVCSIVVSVLLSLPLWCGQRYFPYAQLVEGEPLNRFLEISLVVLMLLCLVGSMFFTFQRLLIFIALTIAVVLVIYDINRVQPWFYIYISMLTVFLVYNGRVDDPNRYTSFFITLQVIFASVYFFCGMNQLNCFFIETDYTQLISPARTFLSVRQFNFFIKMGVMVPYILMITGVFLVISSTRYLAITLAIIIHVLLLIFLFPTFNNNMALWLSNLSFLIMLILLFSGKTKQRYFSPVFLLQRGIFFIAFILFVVMPFFNNRGGWPDHLSANIKSGNRLKATITLSDENFQSLPGYTKFFCKWHGGEWILDYEGWCRHALRSECFPHPIVFHGILRSIVPTESNVKETELQIMPRQPLLCKQ